MNAHSSKPPFPASHPEPVAYDKDGRPLYAHPPQHKPPQFTNGDAAQSPSTPHQPAQPLHETGESPAQPQLVYMARPHEPIKPHISDVVRKKHEESIQAYPHLNLSEGEYVISAIRRHPIGLFSIWGVAAVVLVGLILILPVAMSSDFGLGLADGSAGAGFAFAFIVFLMAVLVVMLAVVATMVYNANRFFLTNESVIQHIQHSLFSKKEQTISLANVEDASFRQHGVVQHTFNYGSLRLSTEGDETTYRFNYVANPKRQIAILNNAVEAFKNGRPFDLDQEKATVY